jgi:hypothetical protein
VFLQRAGALSAPPPGADLLIFGEKKYVDNKTSRHYRTNHSTCFNVNIKHPDDGNFCNARGILLSKIAWGLVTPLQMGVSF